MTPNWENLASRKQVKDKLSLSGSLFNRPKSWLHEPEPPARYTGTPISPGYIALKKALMAAESNEKWYNPPDTSKSMSRRRERHITRSRHSESSIISPRPRYQVSSSVQRSGVLSPRAASALGHQSVTSRPISGVGPPKSPVQRPFSFHAFGNENADVSTDLTTHSGLLHELLQTFFETWLKMPKIKESFIPLLRSDQCTAQEQPPTPDELGIINEFLQYLPEIYIVDRNPRQRNTATEYKNTLNLDSNVLL